MSEQTSASGSVTAFAVDTARPVRIDWADGVVTAIEDAGEQTDPVWVGPGFVDLQVNGYAGFDFNSADPRPETVAGAIAALGARGVTTVCPTICTESEERIVACLAAIADARDADPLVAHAIPAIHIEGPHISREDGPRGAHPLAHVRPPDVAEYRRWQDAARGLVGIVTVSPEWPGSIEYIRALAEDGVVVAIGHTAADSAQVRAAVEAGARLSTHLGNGAHAKIARHPNYIWDQLADDRLSASLILDGWHLPRSVIRTFLRAKGRDRLVAVSDAVTWSGMPAGEYEGFGTRLELRDDGRLLVAGTPYLAGSTSPLDVAIRVAVRLGGLRLADAVRLVTSNPAALLGAARAGGRGAIGVGGPADLVLFRLDSETATVTIERTISAGRTVHARGEATASDREPAVHDGGAREPGRPRRSEPEPVAAVLPVHVGENAERVGVAAAAAAASRLRSLLSARPAVRVMFAAAVSQAPFLARLREEPGIEWSRVTAFQLDEYVGLPVGHPESFAEWLRIRLFDHVRPERVHALDPSAPDPVVECARYAALLGEAPVDIAFIGIGENGHLAFNDPWIADFEDPLLARVVPLDPVSRMQQVHDSAFHRFEAVPATAMTVTIPAIMRAGHVALVATGPRKADAVAAMLDGPISTDCPGSVLRRHPDASVYIDAAAAAARARSSR